MTALTNLTAALSAVLVTSYSTNITHTDNGEYDDCPTGTWTASIPPIQGTVRHTVNAPTERYERVTITEHTRAVVMLTNGTVLERELTNRVVSDRIRTYRLILTEQFVDEKDAPRALISYDNIYIRGNTLIQVTNEWFHGFDSSNEYKLVPSEPKP